MTLELCEAGSLMDMLRRRKRFTEPESRYFMVQLIGACHYMHTHQVIHRDLKLGNLFLDADMNVKVGDFGLAALIENPGERKKTICGTPNYIAPEVLFDTANGHSFEVDTWSIGVILYTLVVGRPPFQTKDVKTIYKYVSFSVTTCELYIERASGVSVIMSTNSLRIAKFHWMLASLFKKSSRQILKSVRHSMTLLATPFSPRARSQPTFLALLMTVRQPSIISIDKCRGSTSLVSGKTRSSTKKSQQALL